MEVTEGGDLASQLASLSREDLEKALEASEYGSAAPDVRKPEPEERAMREVPPSTPALDAQPLTAAVDWDSATEDQVRAAWAEHKAGRGRFVA